MAESQSTRICSVDGCEKPFAAKGWCSYHYKRAHATGSPITPRKKRAPKADAECRKACSVEGCGTPVGTTGARGFCATHYSRFRRTGSAGEAALLRVPRNPPNCMVEACPRKVFSNGYCINHGRAWRKHGDPLVRKEPAHWKKKGEPCEFCGGAASGAFKSRRFCSAVCARLFRAYAGARPSTKPCMRCGGSIDLLSKTKGGQYKRIDAKMCVECKRARATRHGWSPRAIVAHHGISDCGICGEPVDLSLRKPDLMSASIDHIIPFAHGGSNEPENLQLAHLHCNQVKSDSGYKRGRRVKALAV